MPFSLKWQPDSPLWPALCAAGAFAALFGAIGIALGAAWLPGSTRIDEKAAMPPALVELTIGAGRRCAHCGWIESKREIPPGAADSRAPGSYEYTVRMTDGSSSVFQQALPASWRFGERLTVIGGVGPLD